MSKTKQLNKEEAYLAYHHSPGDALLAGQHVSKQVYGTTGISTGSRNLDYALVGTRPSWIRMWVAPSGHGKSTQLRIIAMTEARRLLASTDPRDANKYVAMVSYEEDLGSQELHMIQNAPWKKRDFWNGEVSPKEFLKAAKDRVNLPIHLFGLSMYKESMNKHRGTNPPPTIQNVIDAIYYLHQTKGLLPSVVIIDYIQEVFVPGKVDDNTAQVIAAIRSIEHMATVLNCPVELGAQAKQTVLTRSKNPIPDQNDVEWSYKSTQKATIVVGLIRPWAISDWRNNSDFRTYGIPIDQDNGSKYQAAFTPGLVLAKPAKSRPDVLMNVVPFEVDMNNMTIKDFPNFYQ